MSFKSEKCILFIDPGDDNSDETLIRHVAAGFTPVFNSVLSCRDLAFTGVIPMNLRSLSLALLLQECAG